MRREVFFLLASSLAIFGQESAETLCSSLDAQLSCGQCIKAHTDCAWCIDPHSPLSSRCQLKSKFTNATCTPHLVYSPQTAQVKIQQDLPLEAKHHDGKTLVRLQPQATSVRLMPGHSASVSFKYLHQSDPRRPQPEMMEIQTSDIRDTPLELKFFITCEGSEKETKSCKVQDKQIVEFRVEVHVKSCSTTGDITLSIGVLGQRTISGLYVTTVCGCDCEKHPEMNSRLCHQYGHLVCGQCVCDATRGGDKCECPLALHGVSKSSELEAKCRFNSSSLVCGGNGKCDCGQCKCSSPTISGKFCQCDNTSCPRDGEGKLCSGNGVCDCGTCKCEHGWEREDCSCSSADNNCVENGELCSNNGRCECNRCVCNAGKTGAFCGTDEEPVETFTEEPVSQPTEETEKETESPSVAEDPNDDEIKEIEEAENKVDEVSYSPPVFNLLFLTFIFALIF